MALVMFTIILMLLLGLGLKSNYEYYNSMNYSTIDYWSIILQDLQEFNNGSLLKFNTMIYVFVLLNNSNFDLKIWLIGSGRILSIVAKLW